MIKRFYRKVFVAIVQDGGKYYVHVAAKKQKKLLYKESREFEGTSAHEDIHTYLRKYLEESPLHYVALLNPAVKQGALAECKHHNEEDAIEISGAKTLCQDEEWLLYSSMRELDSIQSQYKTIGLDFIFSPFTVLEHFFKDKIHGGLALYALGLKDTFSVALFEDGKLEYARHYQMQTKNSSILEDDINTVGFAVGIKEEDEVEKGISLDDIESLDDLDILEELDDLSDIEDLDSLEEIVEFSEDEPTFEEKRIVFPRGSEMKLEMDKFNNDYHRFELIQRTLTQFYAGEHCHNRFVETVCVADAYGSGAELKQYLEEELFLNVLIRHIDIADEVMALAMTAEEEL